MVVYVPLVQLAAVIHEYASLARLGYAMRVKFAGLFTASNDTSMITD